MTDANQIHPRIICGPMGTRYTEAPAGARRGKGDENGSETWTRACRATASILRAGVLLVALQLKSIGIVLRCNSQSISMAIGPSVVAGRNETTRRLLR